MAADHRYKRRLTDQGVITEKMIVKDIIDACPAAEMVIKKHLGAAALMIPGSKVESLEFLAAMNDYHVTKILLELNEVCRSGPKKEGHF